MTNDSFSSHATDVLADNDKVLHMDMTADYTKTSRSTELCWFCRFCIYPSHLCHCALYCTALLYCSLYTILRKKLCRKKLFSFQLALILNSASRATTNKSTNDSAQFISFSKDLLHHHVNVLLMVQFNSVPLNFCLPKCIKVLHMRSKLQEKAKLILSSILKPMLTSHTGTS